jgi:hypothetical protein
MMDEHMMPVLLSGPSPDPSPDTRRAGATSRPHLVSPRELLKVFKSSNSESVPDSTVDAK